VFERRTLRSPRGSPLETGTSRGFERYLREELPIEADIEPLREFNLSSHIRKGASG